MWSEFWRRLSGRHKLVHPGLDPVQSAASPQPDRGQVNVQMREALLDPRNAARLADAQELFKFFSSIASRQRAALPEKTRMGTGPAEFRTENVASRLCSSRNAVSRFDIPPLQLLMIRLCDVSPTMSHQLSAGILLGVASAVGCERRSRGREACDSSDASLERAQESRDASKVDRQSRVGRLDSARSPLGLVMQVLALSLASISVVQAVAPTGTALLLVLSHIFLGDRLRRAEYFGIAALVVALGLLRAFAGFAFGPGHRINDLSALLAVTIPTVCGSCRASSVAGRVQGGTARMGHPSTVSRPVSCTDAQPGHESDVDYPAALGDCATQYRRSLHLRRSTCFSRPLCSRS